MASTLTHTRLKPELFLLEPGVTHLTHGSYGAAPLPVLEARCSAEDGLEGSTERFHGDAVLAAVDRDRAYVAAVLTTDPAGLVLVRNVPVVVPVVLGALELGAGAEIVFADPAYGWVKAAGARVCRELG